MRPNLVNFRTMNSKHRELLHLLLLTLVCSLALIWVLQLWQLDIQTPIFYAEGDSFYSNMAVKTVVETGWFHYNLALGAPFGSQLYDFFQPYGANYLILNLLAPLSGGDWVVTLNLFVLLSYYLACWAAWFLFRRLELAPLYAGVAAILFTFIPYHLMRGIGGHLFLSSIFIVPLTIWLALQIASDTRLFSSLKRSWKEAGVAILLGNCGIYYAFIGCFALLLTGVVGSAQQSTKQSLRAALIAISLTVTSIMMTTLPVLVERLEHGENTELAQRSPTASEYRGLKSIQLLLPVEGHRLPLFRKITDAYHRFSPLVSENRLAALGIFGAFGFVLLLFFFIAREPIRKLGGHIELLAQLNLGFFLLGTIGGMGTVIAWMFSPMLRSYNRVSIFIACLALVAAFLFLQWLMRPLQKNSAGRKISLIALCTILVLGLLDQTTLGMTPDHDALQRRFQVHHKFVNALEKQLPSGALIFQTPHTAFPEGGYHHQEEPYAQAIGYLHSKDIRWSYGAIKGRQSNGWLTSVDRLPARERIKYLATAGFSGIYIERRGFPDHALALEKEIGSILGIQPIESSDNHQAFYPIQPIGHKLLPAIATYHLDNGFWLWEGVGMPEVWSDGWEGRPKGKISTKHVWSKGNAELTLGIVGSNRDTGSNRLAFTINSLIKRRVSIYLDDHLLNTYNLSPSQPQAASLKVPTSRNQLRLRFETDVDAVRPSDLFPESKDTRELAFALGNFLLTQTPEPADYGPPSQQADP